MQIAARASAEFAEVPRKSAERTSRIRVVPRRRVEKNIESRRATEGRDEENGGWKEREFI